MEAEEETWEPVYLEDARSVDARLKRETQRDAQAKDHESRFFSLIRSGYKQLQELVNNHGQEHGWNAVFIGNRPDLLGHERSVQLWEKTNSSHEGKSFYTLKCMVRLKCPAHRVITMNADFDELRKKKWEDPDLGHTRLVHQVIRQKNADSKVLKMHDFIEVIDSYVDPPTVNVPLYGKQGIPGVAPRRLLLAQWRRYDKGGQWTMLSQTLPEELRVDAQGNPRYPILKGYENAVDATGFTGLVAKEAEDDPENSCHLTCVVYLSMGGWIPDDLIKLYKYRLVERAEKYERMAQDALWQSMGYSMDVPKVSIRIGH